MTTCCHCWRGYTGSLSCGNSKSCQLRLPLDKQKGSCPCMPNFRGNSDCRIRSDCKLFACSPGRQLEWIVFLRTLNINHTVQLVFWALYNYPMDNDANKAFTHFHGAHKQLALLRHYHLEAYGQEYALTLACETRWRTQYNSFCILSAQKMLWRPLHIIFTTRAFS